MGEMFERDLGDDALFGLSLADHAHHDGSGVRPSVALTAWKTGHDRRTVQRKIAAWLDRGWLEVTAPAGRRQPIEYRINLANIPRKPPLERRHHAAPQPAAGAALDVAPKSGSGAAWETFRGGTGAAPDAAQTPEPSKNLKSAGARACDANAARTPASTRAEPEAVTRCTADEAAEILKRHGIQPKRLRPRP